MNRYVAVGCAAVGVVVGYVVAAMFAIERVDRLLVKLAKTHTPPLEPAVESAILDEITRPRVAPDGNVVRLHGHRHPSYRPSA